MPCKALTLEIYLHLAFVTFSDFLGGVGTREDLDPISQLTFSVFHFPDIFGPNPSFNCILERNSKSISEQVFHLVYVLSFNILFSTVLFRNNFMK
jgi:hypothetical protein